MQKFILNVQILKGKDFIYPGLSANELNTFVRVRIKRHRHFCDTTIKQETSNPVWNEQIDVSFYNPEKSNLLLEVIHRNTNSAFNICDPIDISLKGIQVCSDAFQEFNIQLTKKGNPVGNLVIRLKITPFIEIPPKIGPYKLEFKLKEAINNLVVYASKQGSNSKYAIKFSSNSKFHQEFELMSQINHDNILKAIEFFEMQNYSCYSMPFAEGNDLYTFLMPLIQNNIFICNDRIRFIMKQVLKAISHLHNMGIIHRDIKPENFFFMDVNKTQLKLADFEFACHDVPDKDFKGTQAYMAPEIIKSQPYGFKVDCWGAGIIFHMLLYSEYPFLVYDARPNENWCDIKKLMAGHVSLNRFERPEKAVDLLLKLLCVDPEHRISAENALNHPYFKDEEEEEEEEEEESIEHTKERMISDIEREIESAEKSDKKHDNDDDNNNDNFY